jgi:hypothetical protein
MRISTTYVFSVMLRPKKLEIGNIGHTVKEPKIQSKTECHEIEPNLSKDRAMHEGNNPSFKDELIKFTLKDLVVTNNFSPK